MEVTFGIYTAEPQTLNAQLWSSEHIAWPGENRQPCNVVSSPIIIMS